ncbi:protein CONSERVED ONLY IN THE GREEN LINEAGE 160, chloroplastic isoform X2 [Tripterygium wilfordii]|uniref:protein CONSERVED ONLY IN THE GREEN LINEAGE 160, chloroplastic isoform X2 n=1 Tax=Tripterygium wilfordii TaxID=458696 RepID=UPI0018F7F7A1|nr:protein CONSERVED ONLY IN THE GREEN LINEAGE 160, chloroplastic isoform X2 [Tripterygium wilfordii]
MAILSYISVISSATPISPDSLPPSVPNPRPTKIILPKDKPLKWSTGMAPGEYGGPPTTTKLRKYWGGEKEDPITSDEFIWNNDFMDRMKRLIQDPEDSPEPASVKEESSGFLSLNRVMSLGSLEIDLSKELMASPKPLLEQPADDASQSRTSSSTKWKFVPTRREQDKWDKATKAATGGSDVMFREIRQPRGDPEVLAAQSRAQYFKLKNKLHMLTLGIGGVGLVSAYVSYSPEVAASFGVGLLGSLAYMRMLGNSVDSMADGAKGLVKGAAAQPRLLVPVALVMVFNRWNGFYLLGYVYKSLANLVCFPARFHVTMLSIYLHPFI